MQKRDCIFLEEMTFFGYHGVLEFEGEFGQPFIVDARLETSTQQAGVSDDLQYSTHYGEVFETIQDVVENQRFQLLEALAEQIAAQVLATYPLIEAVTITVKKPHAPIRGHFKHAGVEIYRER